jgi:hypothetical protein
MVVYHARRSTVLADERLDVRQSPLQLLTKSFRTLEQKKMSLKPAHGTTKNYGDTMFILLKNYALKTFEFYLWVSVGL